MPGIGRSRGLADHHAHATDARDRAADRHDGIGVDHDDEDDRHRASSAMRASPVRPR
jgi:hypothetical protein